MYDYIKVVTAISEFIDEEILAKIDDWRKWVIGAGVGLYLARGKELLSKLKENSVIRDMKVIDKDNKIDVELLYSELKKQAAKSAIMFDIPTIGPIVLGEADLDKLYQLITKKISPQIIKGAQDG